MTTTRKPENELWNPMEEVFNDTHKECLSLLMALSVVTMLFTSLLTWIGTFMESPRILQGSAAILLLLVVTQILCVIFLDPVEKDIKFSLQVKLHQANKKKESQSLIALNNRLMNENLTETTERIDLIQNFFKCCGVDGIDDWNYYRATHGDLLPASCCPKTELWDEDGCDSEDAFQTTCFTRLTNQMNVAFEIANDARIIASFNVCAQLIVVIAVFFLGQVLYTKYKPVPQNNSS